MNALARRRGIFTDSRGFTLIELMVVMVIIGLLAAVVAPRFWGKISHAKQTTAKAQIVQLEAALDQFALDTGSYPTTSEGLQALVTSTGAEGWDGPYIKEQNIPKDPWNNPYNYQSPGSHGDYDIVSYGKDGQQGGDGENRDVVSWE